MIVGHILFEDVTHNLLPKHMHYLLGKTEVLRNIALLALTASKIVQNEHDLKQGYNAFVKSIWPSGSLLPDFEQQECYDKAFIDSVLESYVGEDKLTDLKTIAQETSVESMQTAMQHIQMGVQYIREHSPDVYYLFNLVIHTLFYTKSSNSGGGSASNHVGAIWCSNRKTWSTNDSAEFLVHELTHNLLFLDELKHGHYNDLNEIANKENYALSAVLKMQRPLDKTFHSLAVAHEIIEFRRTTGEPQFYCVHPDTQALVRNYRASIDAVDSLLAMKPGLVTDRFVKLFDKMSKKAYVFENN